MIIQTRKGLIYKRIFGKGIIVHQQFIIVMFKIVVVENIFIIIVTKVKLVFYAKFVI